MRPVLLYAIECCTMRKKADDLVRMTEIQMLRTEPGFHEKRQGMKTSKKMKVANGDKRYDY